ncbi:MAG: hypothetical protein KA196_06145 [Arenimonas sp.]|nr:hypothetical protein [Arenimonas sp.]
MSTAGLRGLLLGVLLAAFGTIGGNSIPRPSVPKLAAPMAALDAARPAAPGIWSQARHRACLVTHVALSNEQGSDRRIDCDRELLASR